MSELRPEFKLLVECLECLHSGEELEFTQEELEIMRVRILLCSHIAESSQEIELVVRSEHFWNIRHKDCEQRNPKESEPELPRELMDVSTLGQKPNTALEITPCDRKFIASLRIKAD